MRIRSLWLGVWAFSAFCFAQVTAQPPQNTHKSDPIPRSAPEQSTPATGAESSSKDSKIDLSAPKGDDIAHSDSDDPDNSGVMETKPWNPHRAAKDVEVGDFYYKRKNYKAAISRYREALVYKSNDAEATFKLAQALEASGENVEALQHYQGYLKILKNGEFAPEAQKAIERLKAAQKSADQS